MHDIAYEQISVPVPKDVYSLNKSFDHLQRFLSSQLKHDRGN